MGVHFKENFSHYYSHVKHLRRLQRETLEALASVEKSRNLNQEHLVDLRFNKHELEELRRTLHVLPCIVVTGQNFYAKLIIVTRLLGEQIIPIVNLKKKSEQNSYYSIRLKFGIKNSCIFYGSTNEQNEQTPIKAFDKLTLDDVALTENDKTNPELQHGSVEVRLPHGLLQDGLDIVVTPSYSQNISKANSIRKSNEFLPSVFSSVYPVVLYGITKLTFTNEEKAHLRALKEIQPKVSILFIRVPTLPDSFGNDLPESEQHNLLCDLGILSFPTRSRSNDKKQRRRSRRSPHRNKSYGSSDEDCDDALESSQAGKHHNMPESLLYILCDKIGCLTRTLPPQKLHQRMVDGEIMHYNDYIDNFDSLDKMNDFFNICLSSQLVKAATLLHQSHSRCMRMFILYAFDMAREIQITPRRITYAKEKENKLFENLIDIASKKQDEIVIIISESIVEIREGLLEKATNYQFKDVDLPENMDELTSKDIRTCTFEIQEFVLGVLNEAVGRQLAQRLDLMRKSYFGTLQRCLETLEKDCRDCGESTNVGDTLKQMMNAAYQLDLSSSVSSYSLRSLLEKMKQLVTSMPGRAPPTIDGEWKNKVAQDLISNLSETKLAKNICTQFRDRLKSSHDSFVSSMRQLELQLTSRLEQKEENHLRMKKLDAPKIARMSLESTSIRDKILYGMPLLEKEIGRGQYGVVFGCPSWGGYEPCAIKSLVPHDDKHWNDLAMEFHYTRSVPEHDRIVSLRGSVIDYAYSQCETPAVLLIMERLSRDLYSGIKMGLDWLQRLRISLDVTQGIRFLHSQGLVHRDIKLKNVLLDSENRAKLTDLGFCKPEAMMSGSIVGTPIHMAPELFTGCYFNSVDVYAFGILFWYICSGGVKLPLIFDQCHSKDQLWQCVKKGARPERLYTFSEECWDLMNECWDGTPSQRPFLGYVEPRIEQMMKSYQDHLVKIQSNDISHLKQDANEQDSVVPIDGASKLVLPIMRNHQDVLDDENGE